MRAELNREAVIRLRVDDEGGTLADVTGTPTVTVTDSLGSAVAGVSAVAHDGTGTYKATVPPRSAVDRLTVSWSAVIGGVTRTVADVVDVVSERLVPLWRLREDAELAAISVEAITRLEDTIAEWFRSALKFPPVIEHFTYSWLQEYQTQRLRVPGVHFPRAMTKLTYGRGSAASDLDVSLLTATETGFEYVDSGTFAPVDFLIGTGRGASFMPGYYSARGTHGGVDFETTRPTEDLRRAAAVLARYVARTNNLPERARRIETAASIIDLSMPSAEKPTGLPDVDAVIIRYRIPAL